MRPAPVLEPGWLVYDTSTRRPYVWKSHASEREAALLLADLLVPYPPSSPWRRRLQVAEFLGPALTIGKSRPITKGIRLPSLESRGSGG